jgi:hypothetical protein
MITPSSEPFPAAANYLEMHGTDKTREKLAALKKKRDDLKAMRRKTTSVDLEIKGLENVLARDTSKASGFKRRYPLTNRDSQWLAGESQAVKIAESNSTQAAIEKIDAAIERIPNRNDGGPGEEKSYGMAAVRDQLVDELVAKRRNSGKA